jgi:hypothetical protein
VKTTTTNTNVRRQALRDAAALVSCVTFFLAAAAPAILLAFRIYSATFSLPYEAIVPAPHVIGFLAVTILALLIGGYLGIVAWLLVSRFVFRFSRAEILRCAHAGPHTRFDDWLIDQLFPNPAHDA